MTGLGESVFGEGVEEGREQEKKELVMRMYQNGVPIEDIAKIAEITTEKVEAIISSQDVLT